MTEPVGAGSGAGGTTAAPFDDDALLDSPPSDPTPSGRVADQRPAPVQPSATAATDGGASVAATDPNAAPPQPSATPGTAPDADIISRLRDHGLRPITGETREAALVRLAEHLGGRATRHYTELREIRNEIGQQRQMLEPLLRAFHQQVTTQERAAAMARIPDRETDPEGYRTWLLEENLRLNLARDQTAEETAARSAEEEAVIGADEAMLSTLEEAINTRPDVAAAYEFATESALRAAATRFPEATEEQLLHFVRLAQLGDMRALKAANIDVTDVLLTQYNNARELLGLRPGQPMPAAATQPAQPAPAPPTIPAPSAGGSPTAARIAAQAASAGARAVVAPAAPASSAPSATNGAMNIRGMSEDDWVDYALAHPEVDLDAIIRDTYGKRVGG